MVLPRPSCLREAYYSGALDDVPIIKEQARKILGLQPHVIRLTHTHPDAESWTYVVSASSYTDRLADALRLPSKRAAEVWIEDSIKAPGESWEAVPVID